MHLSEEQIQRLLHDELSPPAARQVRAHLDDCADCRTRVDDARREEGQLFGLLEVLDHPTAAVDATTVAARGRPVRSAWLRRAAGIVLVIGAAGAAYALPGSPVRGWIDSVIGSDTTRAQPDEDTAPADSAGSKGGIAVAPGERLVIEFAATHPDGDARVVVVDSGDVVVRVLRGDVSFTSRPDRLLIDNRHPGTAIGIEIPRGAPHVEITVAGRRVFLKDSSGITSKSRPRPDGSYSLPLAASGTGAGGH